MASSAGATAISNANSVGVMPTHRLASRGRSSERAGEGSTRIETSCPFTCPVRTARLGIDGLGVDFAFPDADLVRPMHKTSLHAGVADVVTSFDALEHLLPEDVDAVLAEMRRVAKPRGYFVFSICTRPSKTTVAGEGLHPTVRSLDWWLDRIGRVATVINPRAERRFIVGRFRGGSDGGCCGA